MANQFITGQDDYDAVRASISVGLSESNLPNALIALYINSGLSELWVTERTLNSDQNTAAGIHAKQAAILYCAARLVKKVVWVSSESISGTSMTVKIPDLDSLESALYSQAGVEIDRAETLNKTIEVQPDKGPLGFETAPAGTWWEKVNRYR
jgi:hypothetical protein